MFFLKLWTQVRKFVSAWFFFKKEFAGKKKKNSLSLDVAAWLHVKRSPDVQVAALACRHCEGCYVPSAAWKRSLQCHCATPEAAWVVSFTCKKKKEISENMTLKGKQKHELSHASKKWNQLYCKLCSCFAESAVDIIGLGSAAALNNDCVSLQIGRHCVFQPRRLVWWGCFVFTASAACLVFFRSVFFYLYLIKVQ